MKYVLFFSLFVILILLVWIERDIERDPSKKKIKKSKNKDSFGKVVCPEVEQLPIDLKSLDDSLARYFDNLDTVGSGSDNGNGNGNGNSDDNNNFNSDLVVKSKLLKFDDQRFEVIFRIDKHLLHNTKPIYLVSYYPQGITISIYDETGNEIGTQRSEDDSGQVDYKKNSTYVETIYDITNQSNEDKIIKTILKQNKIICEICHYDYNGDDYYIAASGEINTPPTIHDKNGQFISQLPSTEIPSDWDQKAKPIKNIFHYHPHLVVD